MLNRTTLGRLTCDADDDEKRDLRACHRSSEGTLEWMCEKSEKSAINQQVQLYAAMELERQVSRSRNAALIAIAITSIFATAVFYILATRSYYLEIFSPTLPSDPNFSQRVLNSTDLSRMYGGSKAGFCYYPIFIQSIFILTLLIANFRFVFRQEGDIAKLRSSKRTSPIADEKTFFQFIIIYNLVVVFMSYVTMSYFVDQMKSYLELFHNR